MAEKMKSRIEVNIRPCLESDFSECENPEEIKKLFAAFTSKDYEKMCKYFDLKKRIEELPEGEDKEKLKYMFSSIKGAEENMLSKEKIEAELKLTLNECLQSENQDGAIKSFIYNEEDKTCTVVLSTNIVEEDNYIGFKGY